MQRKQVLWRTGSHLDSKAVADEVEKVLLALGNGKLQVEIREADFTGACSFFPVFSTGGDDGPAFRFSWRVLSPRLPTPLRDAAPEPGLRQCSLFPRSACFASVLHPDSFQRGSIFFRPSCSWPVSSHSCNLSMFVWLAVSC